ncbi:MAG TPA: glycine cleavage system protein GcvH [Streptosporangiaceae bacterium]|nr:glycine cleavage system protein GcvH [Streptosporangiaceae bacterium]
MTMPEQLRYTPEHEWVSFDGQTATVGITQYAADQLGDVVYVSPPAAGTKVTAGEPCGEIESTKSVSDLFSPVDGEVTEVNADAVDDPGQVNTEPYETWLFRVNLDADPPSDLLTASEYSELISEES